MNSEKKFLIAIPAFNEEGTIAHVIENCKRALPSARILVVDDGSRDNTAAVARKLEVDVLELPFNLGVGGAMRAAFSFAIAKDFDFIVQVDADGQHNPFEIEKLIHEIGNFDVIIGSRFLEENHYKIERRRRFAIRTIVLYLRLLTKVNVSDPTSGFRLSNKKAISFFSETYPVEYLGDTVGSVVLGKAAGLRFTECAALMRPRQGGIPSQSNWKSITHLMRTLLFISMMVSRRKQESP